jgi:hypothetical protein
LVAFSAFRFSVAAKEFFCNIFGVGDGNFAIGKELFRVNCFLVRSGGGLSLCCDGNLDAGENS